MDKLWLSEFQQWEKTRNFWFFGIHINQQLPLLPCGESGGFWLRKFDVEGGELFSLVESAAALAGFRGTEYFPSLGLAAFGADGGG